MSRFNKLFRRAKGLGVGVNMANAISRQYINPVLLPAAGTLSMSIKENYRSAVNHRLVTDLPLVISGWLIADLPLELSFRV